ncbi:MAG: insulinase family protein [Pseudomonadales bacterium]|nr:insulinase family protein [Pseudomonadales bacterium]
MMRKISGLIFGAAYCWLASNVEAATADMTLDNGLRVVVREDHRSPVVVVEVAYRVGAVDEKDGKTGLAHMLEHMMFKGTAKVPGEQYSRIVAHYGGEENAFTTDDFTAYYQVESADRLPLALELEADRMEGLSLKAEDFKEEHRVVMEERRWRIDDNPMALAGEHFSAVANMASPYRRPTIGWMPDIQGLTIEDVRDWYHRWYAPNNAVLVIVGDVDTKQVMAEAQHFFGGLKAHPLPFAVVPREPEVPGQRCLKLHVKTQVPTLLMAFNAPGLRTAGHLEDVYALTMLAGILDQGDSSRMEQDLVRGQQIASTADVSYSGIARGDTLVEFSGIPAQGHGLADLRTAFMKEIKALQDKPPSDEEMKRVMAQLKAADIFSHDSLSGIAESLVGFEAIGLTWHDRDAYMEHLHQVTPEQVQAVARTYLVPERMTVGELEPKS